MKLYGGLIAGGIVVAVLIALGVFSTKWLGDDNIVEDTTEVIVDSLTGVKMDFSPDKETGGLIQDVDWEKVKETIEEENR